MNAKYGIVTYGKRTIIVDKKPGSEDAEPLCALSKDVLRDRYAPDSVTISKDGKTNEIPLVPYWFNHPKADRYKRIDFNPELPPGDNGDMWNLWSGFAVEPREGDWSLFKEHLFENICQEDEELYDWLFNWMALAVQRPGSVIGTAPIFSGVVGVGKGFVAHQFGRLWGKHYISVTDDHHVAGRFNAHMSGRRFIFVDEGIWGGDPRLAGMIKTRVTEPFIMLEHKGIDPIRIRNRSIYMIASNEDSIVPADREDRRWQVFDVGDKRKEDRVYFGAIDRQLKEGGYAAMLFDLLARDLRQGPDPHKTIKTSGLFMQIFHASKPEFKYIFGVLDEGCLPQQNVRGNGPGVTTIRAMHEEMKATQSAKRYIEMQNLGRFLKKVFPGIESSLSGLYEEGFGANRRLIRSTRHEFPPLDVCRKCFEKYVGQAVPWSNDLDTWQSVDQDGEDREYDPPF